MAIELLGRFLGSSSLTSYEPQRQNAGYLLIPNINKGTTADKEATEVTEIIALSVNSLRLPSYGTEPIQLGWFNEFIKASGKSTIDDVDLVIKDFIDVKSVNLMERWFLRVYNPTTGAIGKAKEFKKTTYAIMYSSDGSSYRFYTLEGCFISRFARGDIDQNTSDAVYTTITLSVDRVIPYLLKDEKRTFKWDTLEIELSKLQ